MHYIYTDNQVERTMIGQTLIYPCNDCRRGSDIFKLHMVHKGYVLFSLCKIKQRLSIPKVKLRSGLCEQCSKKNEDWLNLMQEGKIPES